TRHLDPQMHPFVAPPASLFIIFLRFPHLPPPQTRKRETPARPSNGKSLKHNQTAVNLGKIANDRETEAGALRRFVRSNAAPHDGLAHRRLYSGAVVINRNHDPFAFLRAGEPDPGAGPLASVVE